MVINIFKFLFKKQKSKVKSCSCKSNVERTFPVENINVLDFAEKTPLYTVLKNGRIFHFIPLDTQEKSC